MKILKIKADYFLSASSIGRHRNWDGIQRFTPKRNYRLIREIAKIVGAKNVMVGISEPAVKATSLVINF